VYANDGRGWDSVKMEWIGDRVTSETYAEYAIKWHAAGAKIIGGCCGTCPEHIEEMREVFGG
jgi:homocysteine S-methyltransferase